MCGYAFLLLSGRDHLAVDAIYDELVAALHGFLPMHALFNLVDAVYCHSRCYSVIGHVSRGAASDAHGVTAFHVSLHRVALYGKSKQRDDGFVNDSQCDEPSRLLQCQCSHRQILDPCSTISRVSVAESPSCRLPCQKWSKGLVPSIASQAFSRIYHQSGFMSDRRT